MNKLYKMLENLVWVGQLGFSLLFPLVCFLAGCWWLNTHLGVGSWVYIPGLLLGLAVGGCTFWQFAKQWLKQVDKSEEHRPPGFNQH
jgi:apolipoprotein N-acyltransferase